MGRLSLLPSRTRTHSPLMRRYWPSHSQCRKSNNCADSWGSLNISSLIASKSRLEVCEIGNRSESRLIVQRAHISRLLPPRHEPWKEPFDQSNKVRCHDLIARKP